MTTLMAIALIVGVIIGLILINLLEKATKDEEKTQSINWKENFCTQNGYNS